MKINLPLKFCWLTAALLAAGYTNGYSSPIKAKGHDRAVHAQMPVKGTIKDATTGELLIGVSVSIKGTTTGVQSDVNGAFALNANPGDVLVCSYIGYVSQEVTVGNDATISVLLKADAKQLSEVVVTALGISRESKTLSYGVQTFKTADVNAVKDPSLVNTLSGKVAGAQITKSASGVGGSTKVVLRGNKSISGDNNALFVIDGIPMPRLESGQLGSSFGGMDRGDGIENLNSEDVESVTVLPGSAASALYGNQGSNGVILITTKKGLAGKTVINFSSNTTFEDPFKLPDFQNTYGPSSAGANDSWSNTKLSTPSTFNARDFYQTGKTFTNSLSIQTGTKVNQTYFSFESTNSSGIIPDNKLDKYNFSIRNTSQFLNDKLTLDVSANYIHQNVNNRPNLGFYYNPIVPLYLFPRGVDFNQFKSNFEVYDPTRNLMVQNWPYAISDIATQNPYWIVNRNTNQDHLARLLGTISAKYQFTDWLNLQARVKVDRSNSNYEAQNYASSTTTLVGSKGAYTYNPSGTTQTYADAILNFNKKFSDISVNANLGASLQNTVNYGSNTSGNLLNFANLFSISNIDYTRVFPTQYSDQLQTQSVFATATVGYKDKLFLDVTARNDWDSSLAFTQKDNYFYPSVGLTAVLSQMFKLPEFVSFAKLRGNITGVGNGSAILYAANPTFAVSNGLTNPVGAEKFSTLKPEHTTSYEIGTDWRFLNDQITFTLNVYRSFTTDQIYGITPSAATTFSLFYVNGGKVRNEGIEATLGYNLKAGDFSWKPSVNFSLNRNKILTVVDYTDPLSGQPVDLQYQTLSTDYVSLRAQKGGSFGDFYSQTLLKDANGNYITDANGLPQRGTDYTKIGNYNPTFLVGFQNQFNYKNFSLSFLIDGHFGGQVVSMTNALLDQYGTSAATAKARDNGGVDINGKKVDAKKYFDLIDGRNGLASEYVYSATNIRLRELTLGYTLPGTLFNNTVKNIGISVIARNLFFIKNNAPFDPDAMLSTANGFQGLDIFNLPTIRSVGFKVTAQF
ncbi:SusC/RagA family TonB-linked outer membrane protein [Mucilaginibacter sp. BJC16-A38]|uniref:SusC/RagA family TonB-linked outer membrane protein n=1 Tax=Mucilaginibacter phenanthrenivorans TaxID=1234842 RepID=UPI0021572E51|nr:SusC/RagA family TonB-linked outer membrane protein [Mucilaginibacter phenanthrenivorans]MCR8557566.1 SusC/RagA family TonB-linked outer membrane protein [Mucilaginibacter phenanthrenivorans]